MISESFAKKQMGRLSQLPGFGFLLDEALRDLCHAIQNADTEAIATRVISDFCSNPDEGCPGAAVVRAAMNRENERWLPPGREYKLSDLRPPCDFCEGTGWIHVTHGRYSGVKECGCRRARIEAKEAKK